MKSSDEFDREQRQAKRKKKPNWAKTLVRPLTVKTLFKMAAWGTRAAWVVFKIIDLFRE